MKKFFDTQGNPLSNTRLGASLIRNGHYLMNSGILTLALAFALGAGCGAQ